MNSSDMQSKQHINGSAVSSSLYKSPSRCEEASLSLGSTSSLSSLASTNSLGSQIKTSTQNQNLHILPSQPYNKMSVSNFTIKANPEEHPNHLSDDDENNSSSGEDHKQYEAACIIQKYYRRYKQVIFL